MTKPRSEADRSQEKLGAGTFLGANPPFQGL